MKRKKLSVLLVTLAATVILAACSTALNGTSADATSTVPEITIKAVDYAFEAPAQIESGIVTINLINEGAETHHGQLARLNDDVSFEQFVEALQSDAGAAMALIALAGGPGAVDPGLSQKVTLNLVPGSYVWLDFIPSPTDGAPHLAKGMIAQMDVVTPSEATARAAVSPSADGTATLVDFSFIMPAEIRSGRQIWEVTNNGAEPHEIMLVKLADNKTVGDLNQWVHTPSGPPPFTSVGGFQAIGVGESGWMHLDLEPGAYVALCNVPDMNGVAHTEHGMVLPFVVN